MEGVIIRSMAEYKKIKKSFRGTIIIDAPAEEEFILKETFKFAELWIRGRTVIQSISGSASIQSVYGSASIQSISGSASIKYVSGSAIIQSVSGSASIKYVSDSASIKYVSGSASIQSVSDSASIKYVYDSASIKYVSGSASIKYVYDSASIKYVSGSAIIQSVYGNAVVCSVSAAVTISKAGQQATIICVDCEMQIEQISESVVIVRRQKATYDLNSFSAICEQENGKLILYKSVQSETLCDFYTGRIKYEGDVICPDWDPDPNRECGGGLHLSFAPEKALSFNQGTVLRCLVDPADIVVYPANIEKVRCRKVTVLGPLGKDED